MLYGLVRNLKPLFLWKFNVESGLHLLCFANVGIFGLYRPQDIEDDAITSQERLHHILQTFQTIALVNTVLLEAGIVRHIMATSTATSL